jgi:hypothetical protein
MKDVQELTLIGEIQEVSMGVPYFMGYNLSPEGGEASSSFMEKCFGDMGHFCIVHQ